MSYEPLLIITRDDLRRHEDEICNFKFTNRKVKASAKQIEKDAAYGYLARLIPEHGTKIKGDWFILCRPELTSFNRSVRDVLDFYDIEYATYC